MSGTGTAAAAAAAGEAGTRTAGATAVLDIGKSNVKLTLVGAGGAVLAEQRRPNRTLDDGPYPHHDVEGIWQWLLAALKAMSALARIEAIVPVTHGATAVLVDDAGLVLPVLDYESTLPQELSADYRRVRPAFADSGSPDLPAGLNLGRQLYWQARTFPAQFARARHILMYPQYWAWRLCGVAASEVTSLGCHTDLWQPLPGRPSSLVDAMDRGRLLPPLRTAWTALGPLRGELAAATGLPADCKVLCGIQDSNASLLRYLDMSARDGARRCTVLSTGTWVIAAALGRTDNGLSESLDMLANVSAVGKPVACMRFMGGREFAALAGPQGEVCEVCDGAELAGLIERGSFALPSFADAGGPFVGRVGVVSGPPPRNGRERYALATIYCALMSDYCLDALQAEGSIVIEGSFAGNAHFAGLLAGLRGRQEVLVSDDECGTTCGGWMLHRWGQRSATPLRSVHALTPRGWLDYRNRWRALIEGPAGASACVDGSLESSS
ncbi:FGGY family carbohydrate kinase [Rugamonas sp.]|uniref:FGGY-family carbohydrate kinase n=1 Tax=Rugamonas sp. TaxID=1926287 RepID=UPI0025D72711|nr:FGGY family carbohydrate kinase [Rugamonas sp.]